MSLFLRSAYLIAAFLGGLIGSASAQDQSTDDSPTAKTRTVLSVGSKAPRLNIEHWIHEKNDVTRRFEQFEPGKVYVIEFWATWCGPCVSAMPFIASLQKKYADHGVSIISVTDEELKTVNRFLERTVRGSKVIRENDGKDNENDSGDGVLSYDQLTSSYHLACDPDGSTNQDYMLAANRNGIPCSFLIGKSGVIEWVGHPVLIEDPLEKVVNDQWDRDAFIQEYRAEQEANDLITIVSRHIRADDTSSAVDAIDTYLSTTKLKSQQQRFQMMKLQILANDPDYFDRTSDYALELLVADDHDPESANDLTWAIYELAESGEFENQEVLKAALKLSMKQSEVATSEIKPYIMDTTAHLQHFTGDHESAWRTQRKAYRIADDKQKHRLKEFLDELAAINKGSASDDQKPPGQES